jgi:transcriptional regulator with XRE-family HTH domain
MNTATESTKKNKIMLKELRESQGLSQDKVSASIGIERARYSEIERGNPAKWLVNAIRLERYLKKFGYTLEDLILSLPDPDESPEVKP